MEGFEEAVKYINVYKLLESSETVISMHVEAPKPAEEATDNTAQCSSAPTASLLVSEPDPRTRRRRRVW